MNNNKCPHINTIDVGDSDYTLFACTDCQKILGDRYIANKELTDTNNYLRGGKQHARETNTTSGN